MSKPEIILVPGAWHKGDHYEPLLGKLREQGYGTVSGQLPSTWTFVDPEEQTVNSDAEFVRNTWMMGEIENGKDVIIMMHSYGGFPGAVAAKGWSKAERLAAGKKGGVIGLIFMAAFVGHEGFSLKSSIPGDQLAPWTIVDEETRLTHVDNPAAVFYSETDSSVAAKAVKNLHKQSLRSFTSPSGPPAWKDEVFNGHRAYIKCKKDLAIPYEIQNVMVSMSGVDWKELDLDAADHSPFINHADEICDFVNELSAEWAK